MRNRFRIGIYTLVFLILIPIIGCNNFQTENNGETNLSNFKVFWSKDQSKSPDESYSLDELNRIFHETKLEAGKKEETTQSVKELVVKTNPGEIKTLSFKIWNTGSKTSFKLTSYEDWITFQEDKITVPTSSEGIENITTAYCYINLPEDVPFLPRIYVIDITGKNGESQRLRMNIFTDSDWVGANGSEYKPDSNSFPKDIIPCPDGINSWCPTIDIDSKDKPHIAWRESVGEILGWEIFYIKWNGTDWVTADDEIFDYKSNNANVSRNGTSSSESVMVLDSKDNPHIVWHDWNYGENSEIMYVKWDGKNWVCANDEVYDPKTGNANISRNNNSSQLPDIALDSNDYPHITWNDEGNDNAEIFYIKWNGQSWICANGEKYDPNSENANISRNRGNSRDPSIALDFNDMPHIAWDDFSADVTTEVFYLRWDGSDWVTANGLKYDNTRFDANVSRNTDQSFHPSIAVDSRGYPNIAWMDYSYSGKGSIFARWDGTCWVCSNGELYNPINGNGSFSTSSAYYSCLALDYLDNPHITWSGADDIQYIRMKGTRAPNQTKWLENDYRWVNSIGQTVNNELQNYNVSTNEGHSSDPVIALDSKGMAHIVWMDDSADDKFNYKIFYLKNNSQNMTVKKRIKGNNDPGKNVDPKDD